MSTVVSEMMKYLIFAGVVMGVVLIAFQPAVPFIRFVSIPTLEARVEALEKTVQVCCTTQFKPGSVERELEVILKLRAKVKELELRIEFLEER